MLQVGISLMMVLCLTANLLLPAVDGIGLRTARAEAAPVKPLHGLTISIMGDSISTYSGWSDAYPIAGEEYTNRYGEAYYGPVGGDFHNMEMLH